MDYSLEQIHLTMSLWMFGCALIGSIYGMANFILKKKAMYLKMIACGIGCRMFAMLFVVIYILAQGHIRMGFHIGIFGIIGSFMFFFTANYGQMDSLVDDGVKKFNSARLKSFIAPILILLIYFWFYLNVEELELRLVLGAVTMSIQCCIYYNFKHVIIYDVDYGIIRCVRAYNVLACAYELLTMLELTSYYMELKTVYVVCCVLIGIISVVILPALKKGADRWIMGL